jgi:hypothetical protein
MAADETYVLYVLANGEPWEWAIARTSEDNGEVMVARYAGVPAKLAHMILDGEDPCRVTERTGGRVVGVHVPFRSAAARCSRTSSLSRRRRRLDRNS